MSEDNEAKVEEAKLEEAVEEVKVKRASAGSPAGLLAYMDGLLRNREAYFEEIFEGDLLARHLGRLLLIILVMSGLHGLIMGASSGLLQMLSSGVKVPALFLLTLAVCYPMLYVINVIMGSRLSFGQTLALILLALALSAVLLASFSPIALFFTIKQARYNFLQLLHVAIFACSGAFGMFALWQGLQAMCEQSELYPKQALVILRVWAVIFAFVGLEMAWSLRPFVGKPGLEFELFRSHRHGTIYETVGTSAYELLNPQETKTSKEDAVSAAKPKRPNAWKLIPKE